MIALILVVIMSIFSSILMISTGGSIFAINNLPNKNKQKEDEEGDFFDKEFEDDGVEMKDNPFFQVKFAKNELIEAEKALMKQKAESDRQDLIDKAEAKVKAAKKKVEWVSCYEKMDCGDMCVRYGDKIQIVKADAKEYKLEIEGGYAREVSTNSSDTNLVFQDISNEKERTEAVGSQDDPENISQKCVKFNEQTRIAKYSNQEYSLELYNGRAFEKKDKYNKNTLLVIKGGSGKLRYGEKFQIWKNGREERLRLKDGKAREVKDDKDGTYFIAVKK
jgi:hypothetical protein